jgi:uncharacterized protein (UPF0332 family)
MAIEEKDFLTFSESLPETSEINIRNSVGRAYYAAYHMCDNYYQINHNLNIDGGIHVKLFKTIISSPVKEDKKVGFMLRQLHQYRVESDYALDADVTLETKKSALKMTRNLISELDQLKENAA